MFCGGLGFSGTPCGGQGRPAFPRGQGLQRVPQFGSARPEGGGGLQACLLRPVAAAEQLAPLAKHVYAGGSYGGKAVTWVCSSLFPAMVLQNLFLVVSMMFF